MSGGVSKPQADLYSLGWLLVRLVTGLLPDYPHDVGALQTVPDRWAVVGPDAAPLAELEKATWVGGRTLVRNPNLEDHMDSPIWFPEAIEKCASELADNDAPRVGVHVMSEFIYCPRAGIVTVDQQREDTGCKRSGTSVGWPADARSQ